MHQTQSASDYKVFGRISVDFAYQNHRKRRRRTKQKETNENAPSTTVWFIASAAIKIVVMAFVFVFHLQNEWKPIELRISIDFRYALITGNKNTWNKYENATDIGCTLSEI